MKPHLLNISLLSILVIGFRADGEDYSQHQKELRKEIDALQPQATKDGALVPEVIAKMVQLEAEEMGFEMLARQVSKRKHLASIPESERFAAEFGTSRSENKTLEQFSLLEACNVAASGRPAEGVIAEMQQQAKIELRDSQAGANITTVAIPRIAMEFLKQRIARARSYRNATQSATGVNLGSQFVQTDVRPDLIQMSSLLPSPVLERAGAFMLRGLVGNIMIPIIAPTGAITTKTENSPATSVDHVTISKTLSPKRLPVSVDVSDQLVMQASVDVEALLWMLLQERVNLTKDMLSINGDGTAPNPLGILGTLGIGSVAGGTNGAGPTEANMIDLETAVANANASGNLYLTNSRARGFLKKQAIVAGYPDKVWGRDNTLNGYGTLVSNTVPNTLIKGGSGSVCSAILFGDFSKVLLASWGGMMLERSRDKTGAITGTGTLVVTEFFDSLVLQPAAIAAMQDALCG